MLQCLDRAQYKYRNIAAYFEMNYITNQRYATLAY